jgi:hypothetical protein
MYVASITSRSFFLAGCIGNARARTVQELPLMQELARIYTVQGGTEIGDKRAPRLVRRGVFAFAIPILASSGPNFVRLDTHGNFWPAPHAAS